MFYHSQFNLIKVSLCLYLIAIFNTESASEETERLSVKKCCHLNEAYDVETKNCFKIQDEKVVFEPYDYFADVLSMVDVAYDYENIEFPSDYNIRDVGKPYCNPKDSEEQLLFNIPVDPDLEHRGDLESNDAFRIEFPSHELFEINQNHSFPNSDFHRF